MITNIINWFKRTLRNLFGIKVDETNKDQVRSEVLRNVDFEKYLYYDAVSLRTGYSLHSSVPSRYYLAMYQAGVHSGISVKDIYRLRKDIQGLHNTGIDNLNEYSACLWHLYVYKTEKTDRTEFLRLCAE